MLWRTWKGKRKESEEQGDNGEVFGLWHREEMAHITQHEIGSEGGLRWEDGASVDAFVGKPATAGSVTEGGAGEERGIV